MNMRAAFARAEEPASAVAAARLGERVMATLAKGISAVFYDAPKGAGRGRLTCTLDDAPLGPPFICTSLERLDGGLRHLALLGQPLAALTERRLALALDGQAAALADPAWLQPPVRDAAALVEGLTPAARLRLLRLVFGTGASLFLKRRPAYPALARDLLGLCAVEPAAPIAQAAFGPHRILTYRLDADGRDATREAILLARASIAPLKGAALCPEAEAGLLHLHLPAPLGPEAEIVLLADRPLRLAGAPDALPTLPATRWARGRGAATAAWLAARLHAAAAESPALAAAARELRSDAAQPDLTLRHLSATPAGLVYALDLADPEGFAQAIRFERGGRAVEVAPRLRLDGAGTLAGFAVLPEAAGETCRIRLVHHSGRARTIWEGAPAAFDGAIPAGFAAAVAEERAAGLPGAALAALAAARARLPERAPPARIQAFGPAILPDLSLLAPASEDPDIVRARAALVWAERGGRAVEIVLSVAEGPRATALRRLAEEAAAVYGVAHRIVTLPPGAAPDSAPGAALRAGLTAARGAGTLCLGAEVLPEGRGWIAAWRRRLLRAEIVGGLLLEADGSVGHAGGEAGARLRFRGLPRRLLPAGTSRPSRVFTDEAVGLSRAGAERLLAAPFCPDPQVALAALAAAGRAGGRPAVTAFAAPCRRFGAPPRNDDLAERLRAAELALVLGDAA